MKISAIAAAIGLLSLGIAAQAVTIETVTVGDPGNTAYAFSNISFGKVDYTYNIGKYEVTAGQYCAFLNAVAKTDTYGLYNSYMASTRHGSGISRAGSSGNYSYAVDTAFVNRPVNGASFWDACRFANWLNNGQESSDTETGAYTLDGYNGTDGRTIQRNANWKWAVTSEDEWFKAAYYDPNKAGGAGYWWYPTRSNTAPGQDMNDASGNNANCYNLYHFPIDNGKCTTVVGEFQNSASAYGTFDQAGNVDEWNEDILDIINNNAHRGQRGGSWGLGTEMAALGCRGDYLPNAAGYGFRVVQAVPEPSSILALAAGLVGLFGIRRRKA